MANARSQTEIEHPSIEIILSDFRKVYSKSILVYAQEYLATGEEYLSSNIALRAQAIKPTAIDVKELLSLIKELIDKEQKEKVLLTTREAVLVGAAYEFGLCLPQNYEAALFWYMAGSQRVNTEVSEKISNRDRGHALANACSLFNSNTAGIKEDFKKVHELAAEAASLGSQYGFAHLGHSLISSGQREKGILALEKAPEINFATGCLGFIYQDGRLTNQQLSRHYFEIASRQGDVQALVELSEYYKSRPDLYAVISYESSLRQANYFTPSEKESAAKAKATFNQTALDNPILFAELADTSPWMYVKPLLEKAPAQKFLNTKSIVLARYNVELLALLPADLTNLVMLHICLPEYIFQSKWNTSWQRHLTFWQNNRDATPTDIQNFIDTENNFIDMNVKSRRNSESDLARFINVAEENEDILPQTNNTTRRKSF